MWPQSGFIRVEPYLAEICTNLRHFRYYWSLTRLKLESENETRVRKLTQLTRVTRLELQALYMAPKTSFEDLRAEAKKQVMSLTVSEMARATRSLLKVLRMCL